jgi:zinc protease
VPDGQLPLVDVLLLVRTGAIHDPADKVGLASFTAQMLRHGTQRASADAIAERVERAGASLGVSGGYEFSSVTCRGRTSALETCLRTVAELARTPSFPEAELPEVRALLTEEVKSALDDPEELAAQHFANLLYGDDHPAGRPLTMSSLQRIARADLVRFHREHYAPQRALLVIAGDVTVDGVTRQANALLGDWRGGSSAPPAPAPVRDPPLGLRVLLVDKPDLTQSFFALGHAGIAVGHPQLDAVRVMNYVLGSGGFSSRLMQVVRAQGGKTYGVSSEFSSATDDGSFVVQTFTRHAELVSTLRLVQQELHRIRDTPPSTAELTAARGKIAGGYAIRFKTGTDLALALAEAELRGLPETRVTELALRVDRLSAAEVAAAARTHVRPERLVAAIVGRAAEVAPLLRRANIAFEQIGYLDPISARERAARRAQTMDRREAVIPPAERQRALRLLGQAIRAAGGAARLAAVKALRLSGTAQRGAQAAPYRMIVIPPDELRVGLALGTVNMVLTVTRTGGFAQITGAARQPLPAAKLAELRAEIARQPPLVLLAAQRAARLRVADVPGLARGSAALQAWLDADQLVTLVLDRAYRLTALRYTDGSGGERVTELGDHRRVAGVLVPHRVAAFRDGQQQVVRYDRVEVNPVLTAQEGW